MPNPLKNQGVRPSIFLTCKFPKPSSVGYFFTEVGGPLLTLIPLPGAQLCYILEHKNFLSHFHFMLEHTEHKESKDTHYG